MSVFFLSYSTVYPFTFKHYKNSQVLMFYPAVLAALQWHLPLQNGSAPRL